MGAGAYLRRVLDADAGLLRLARTPVLPLPQTVLIGLAGAAIVLALRGAFAAFYGDVTGFMILLPGVILAGLAGGGLSGLVAVAACLTGGWLLVQMGETPSAIGSRLGLVATVNFIVVGLFATLVAASLRRTLCRLDATIAALRESTARADESESRLALLSDQAPALLWMSDETGKCVHLNREQREFWDAPRDLSGFDFAATIHPDDRAHVFAASAAALEGRQPLVVEARYRRHDGAWRMLRTEARPRFDQTGRFIGMIGVNADVTEARAAAAALREREAQLKAMVDQASAGIARLNLDGSVASGNARFAQILGLAPEQVVGVSTPDVTHPDDIAPTLERLDRATRGEDGQLEKRYIRPDGSVVWALTSVRPLRDEAGEISGYIAVIIDITDAKAAEAAMRESEARFRLLADTAPSPVWMTNAEGEVEFVNAALAEFYARPREAIMGHVWRDSVHPEDLPLIADAQAEARPRRRPYGFEVRFRRGDGAWRWMRVKVNPRFDAHREFVGYVGISFDVTESREALEALARQERRQTFLLELTDRLRDLADPDEIMGEVERALGDVLGADRVGYGEVDQTRGTVFMTRDWTAGVRSARGQFSVDAFGSDLITDLAAGRVIQIPDVRQDPRTAQAAAAFDGIETRALIRAPLIRNGRLRAFLYVHASGVRRWTEAEVELVEEVAARTWAEVERARAEVELRESEQRFRAIADTAPVLIWVTNEDRSRAFVNQAYVAFSGGTYEEARLLDWREILHPDDQERILRESVAGEATREPFSMEARYRHHDGRYRWLKSFSRPRIAGGEVIGFVGVAFDVTEAKQVADDLRRINELLEERVGEALAEKAKAEADLMHAQRMEAVGRLTGGVAHDFNNLLTVVIGALDIILRSDDPAKRQKLGEAALAAARRGERLTHQLLAFSRRQTLRPEPVDLNGLIRESEPLLRRAVGEAVEFKLKLKRGGARVKVDPAQFEAALLNLIVNARDAVAEGGHITVRTSACAVAAGEVAELPAGDYLCVAVSDDGVGMTPEIIDRVFEPFFTTKAIGKGTGLGLSQVYGFARQTGGGVRIRSAPGEGAEICLYLPPLAADAAPAADAPRSDPRVYDGAARRLLLVEDDVGVAAIAVDLLTGMGLEVTAVETAPQALEALKTDRFDVMLSDIVMPGGMNGVELARQAAPAHPEMRIILASGYAGDDVDEALNGAPWPLLRKPYSAEELRRILDEGAPLPA